MTSALRRAWVMSAFVAALGLGGAASSCTLELDHDLACGDGVTDRLAGEQCDPRDPESPHLTYCEDRGLGLGVNGTPAAACDEQCRVVAESCHACGDGILQAEFEECEPAQICVTDSDCIAGGTCDGQTGTCLDGQMGSRLDCAVLHGPLGPYVSGSVDVGDCTSQCRFDRSACSYCGDGALDGAYEEATQGGSILQPAEACELAASGPDPVADSNQLDAYCKQVCSGGSGTTLAVRCKYSCADGCSGFDEQHWENTEAAGCCVLGGEECDVGGLPCCWALDHPDEDPAQACNDNVGDGQAIVPRCRTKPPDGD